MQRRYLLAIIIFVVFVIVAVSGFLLVKHLNEKKLSDDEKQFFDMKWISFCGRINRKQWVSHNAVNNVANKILQIKNSYPTKKRKKNIFPYSILFVSSEGNKCTATAKKNASNSASVKLCMKTFSLLKLKYSLLSHTIHLLPSEETNKIEYGNIFFFFFL